VLRARWHERRGDIPSAVAELSWYENNDVFERPSGPPQVADVDWAFGTLALWRSARLLDAAGDRGEVTCRDYAAVGAAWAKGEARLRARADSAARRVLDLGCQAAT